MGELERRQTATPEEQRAVSLEGSAAIGELAKRSFAVYADVTEFMVKRTREATDPQHRRYLAIHTEAMAQQVDHELRQTIAVYADGMRFLLANWWKIR
jgi:hypothetical protein